MKKLVLTALILSGLAGGFAAADEGKQQYATCIACHGDRGQGMPALNAPALAGLDAAYLGRQLKHFRNGIRGADERDTYGRQMAPMAAVLTDDAAVAAVAAYIAGLSAVPVEAPSEADFRNGENQYNAACGACHGATAQGNPALNAPRLSGLDAAYLRRQYENFAAGVRGAHADDKYGRQMAMMATMLASEKDLLDVIAFITSQGAGE
jgi:cytochrome c oxidase subunit 2